MVNTRTDAELAAAVQAAVDAMLPQIREQVREEYRTGAVASGSNPPPVTIHTWLMYGYSKNHKKTVKTGQTRTRERIECTRAGRMLSSYSFLYLKEYLDVGKWACMPVNNVYECTREEIQRMKANNQDISHREAFSTAAKNMNHIARHVRQ
ncbi:zinc finger, CCHC-type, retrotransposon gag domain protein, partial [Tanacetum coccineum]